MILTVVNATGPGYVTAWNGTSAEPVVSTVNYGFDAATANSTIVPVTPTDDGRLRFNIRNHVGSANFLIDVVGWYGSPAGYGGVYRVTPQTRILDSRDDQDGPLGPDSSADVAVPDLTGGIRPVVGVAMNVTAVNATTPTYVTVWGSPRAHPVASALNPSSPAPVADGVPTAVYIVNATIPNSPYIFHVYNFAGSVDLVIDLQGVFVRDPYPGVPLS